MDIDEPELSQLLPGESTEHFVARVRLAARVLPVLRDLVAQRFALVVEADRKTSRAAALTSDFVLEFGDARLRIILAPREPDPLSGKRVNLDALAHYILDVPDTDALAIVADNERLSTYVFDVYALNSTAAKPLPADLGDALNAYFDNTVHPIELPDFHGLLTLPSTDRLESILEREARAALERIRTSRVRIEEKVTALGLIGPLDSRHLVETVLQALQGRPSLSTLISEEEETND